MKGKDDMAKETFYKYTTIREGTTVKHVKVAMTSREVKAYIMRVNNWTSEQYNKQYDILRNKTRAYESYERASGVKVEKQSVQSLLFKEARSKQLYGPSYEPSLKMKRIRSFTSVSSGKAGQKALTSETYRKRRGGLYADTTYKRFKGLIESNNKAKEIYESIDDPVKRENALSAYANKIHARINEKDEESEGEAIPVSSEVYGSEDPIDFDYSEYL